MMLSLFFVIKRNGQFLLFYSGMQRTDMGLLVSKCNGPYRDHPVI